jgi:hypothetical protein
MDEQGVELLDEARKLGYGCLPPNMFHTLYEKFDVFAALNPSLQRAYDAAFRRLDGIVSTGDNRLGQ